MSISNKTDSHLDDLFPQDETLNKPLKKRFIFIFLFIISMIFVSFFYIILFTFNDNETSTEKATMSKKMHQKEIDKNLSKASTVKVNQTSVMTLKNWYEE